MKKILLFASALAGLFLAGSCQRENLEPMQSANTVTYTVQLPGALSTKTIGEKDADVAAVTELVYEVYRTEATSADDFTQAEALLFHKTATITDGTATVEFELVNDQNFRVLFWAQVPGNGVYTVDNLKNVTISQTLYSNAEKYAAFAGTDYIKAGESIVGRTLPLVRPIAQLNIGTDDASLWIENQTKALISTSAVKVNGLSTTFNVAENKAGEISTADYVYAAKPVALSESTFAVNGTNYNYVAMNYVGFAPQMGTNVKVTYTINTENVGTIENTIDNVPVKANHRTNIVGNLITSMSDYTITLTRKWDDEEYNVEVVSVATAEDLQEAIDNIQTGAEGNIKLEGDIDLNDLFASLTKAGTADSQSITILEGVELTVDLNGYTLTGVDETEKSFGLITNKGNLTIVNSAEGKTGKIKLIATKESGWSRYSSVISTQPGSTLTVGAGVEIEHLGGTSMSYAIDVLTNGRGTSAVAVIDGATVKSPYRPIRQFLNGTEAVNSLTVKAGSVIKSTNGNKSIWMQDPSANANTGSLVVEEGAELYGNVYISATAGSTEWPVSASVAASALKDGSKVEISPKELVGYNVVLNDGVYVFEKSWSVDGDEYTIYTAAGLKWVAEEVNKVEQYAKNIFDGKTVLLANDIDLNGAEWIPIGDFGNTSNQFTGTFDGQNHTISNFVVDFNENKVDSKNRSSFGFFGNVNGTVKNLTVSGVTNDIKTPKFVGALIGRLNGGLVENCHVKNSTIEINNWTVGALVGQINNGKISGCSVEGTTIKGYGAVAGIVGIALSSGDRTIENCSVKNTTIVQNGSFGGNYDNMFGAIVGALNSGTLTVNLNACSVENTTIKDVTSTELCGFVSEGGKLVVDGYEILAPGLGYNSTSKTYAVSSAEGLVAMSEISIKARESVVLTADIDLAGVEFNGLSAFHPEEGNTFDGNGFKVSNWTNESGASDMAFIKSWVGTIKDVTIVGASLKTDGRSAVLAANVYANIENCHVVNSTIEDSYWACGVIAGLYNSGSITNCSVDGCSVKSNGGVGGIVGVINEAAGERKVANCTVKNTIVNNTGVYGAGYSGALVAGMFNADGATYKFINCTLENNTKEGQYVGDLFYSAEGETVYVDGVQQ